MADRFVAVLPAEEAPEEYELVVANILARTLVQLQSTLDAEHAGIPNMEFAFLSASARGTRTPLYSAVLVARVFTRCSLSTLHDAAFTP